MADLILLARAQELPSLAAVNVAYLAHLITAASAAIAKYCKREFPLTVYASEYYHGNGGVTMFLRHFPVTLMTSIVVVESAGTTVTIAGTQFDLHTNTGEIRFIRNCTAGYCYFPAGFNNLQANYTAGFATVPEDVQEACAHLCAYMYGLGSLTPGVKSEKLGDYAKSFGSVGAETWPVMVRGLLDQYRNIRP